ncbi:MAG: DEAD/DEAH box helicase [Verrucomicrobia bacterium]|nr:DEAD/DEAH box helicase [Verrucomicrobiota bacterium]
MALVEDDGLEVRAREGLADDMGLGKTLQTLAWLLWLRTPSAPPQTPDAGPRPLPSLVVCPKSVTDNWRAEVERFAPGLRVKVWSGTAAEDLPALTGTADLHVLNYTQLRLVGESLARTDFQAVILDEGQYIKNPSSQTAQIARALRAEHRLVLSGTPIENRLLDLWSLMSFAMPGVLGSRAQFTQLYDAKEDPHARRRLSARVRPFLLRRTKSQVARDLPDRVEEDLYCEIEGEQKTLYRAELKRAQQMLLKVSTQKQLNQDRFHFLTSLLRLRQICCHPRLVKADSKAESAKLEALLDQLEPLMDEGHKVLVFSQFVSLLDLLKVALAEKGWPVHYLAGDTENRGAVVRDFQAQPGGSVFLISLKAGGFGLNLTAASYVVLFDPWWNPAVEAQAIDRTHRIGQTHKVIAYRLLIKDSIEEKIRALQKTKRALAEDVLGEEKFAQALTLDDLRFLFAD